MYPRSLSESGLDWSGLVKRANMLKLAAPPNKPEIKPIDYSKLRRPERPADENYLPPDSAVNPPPYDSTHTGEMEMDEHNGRRTEQKAPPSPAEKAFRAAVQGTTTKASPPLQKAPPSPAEKAFRAAVQGTTTKAGPPLDNDDANQQAVDESAGYFDDSAEAAKPGLLGLARQNALPLGLAALLVGGGGAGLAYYLNKRRKKRPPMGM